jgi:TRAP-type C4-dicarboxylate transport system substrate-binding protein
MTLTYSAMNDALKKHVVDRAITATISGYGSKLREVATHVHPMTPRWGHNIFAASTGARNRLDPATQSGAIWNITIGWNAGLTAIAE